jgi:predicted DsbA family dithiol-disulfide isomerase
MRAYFSEGEPISDPETLVRLVAELGVDPDEARAALEQGRFAEDVREDEQLAAQLGIQGVPFFVLDRRYGVSGAQPPEALLQALERAWGEAVSLRT